MWQILASKVLNMNTKFKELVCSQLKTKQVIFNVELKPIKEQLLRRTQPKLFKFSDNLLKMRMSKTKEK